ncbi:hypothetical protein CAOG_03387 [Capsaspora owczarzaki ATCC 30864]|uniref:hypothetical protein n=1 Tax=Capsaspora owczarzaki (strain ATCC 30864) TaxID=595528 RepID=UPI0003526EBB|nr:hypothetical protein CAOG_03387 [Capsaspora owczarzaki ATCC 30864]|eukprot:XP_004364226.2 hypothetical protein CAOG_03387 [Capsaspora owczarzaki ATCC 30864]
MKFRFCGDLDCPDWVLAEISLLSKMTSVKMKLLVVQVIDSIIGGNIDYNKVFKLTSDAKYELSDVKASIAAISFIISSSSKYAVDGESLSNELQQLGLPKEHAGALCRAYADSLDKLQTLFKAQSLRLPTLKDSQWRVDYLLSSSELETIAEPSVTLNLTLETAVPKQTKKKPAELNADGEAVASQEAEQAQTVTSNVAFEISSDKFRLLFSELKHAHDVLSAV